MKLLILCLFFSSTSAVIFECNFEPKAYNVIGSNFSCVVINYGYSSDAPRITDVTGEYQQSRTNKDIRGVSINFAKIKICYIPKGFELWFPNFTIFEMYYGCITRFNGSELDGYINLKSFIFTYSQLEWIPGNFFSNNKQLEYIEMTNNRIKFVASNLLNELKSLKYVTFETNQCISKNGLATKPADIDAFKNLLRASCSTGELLTTLASTSTTTPKVTTSTSELRVGSPYSMIASTTTPPCNTSTTSKGISTTVKANTVRAAIATNPTQPGGSIISTLKTVPSTAKLSSTTPKSSG